MLPSCAHCGDDFIILDTPKGNRHMYKYFLKGKEFIPKGRSKADKSKITKEAVKKSQKDRKRQVTIDFASTPKKEKNQWM